MIFVQTDFTSFQRDCAVHKVLQTVHLVAFNEVLILFVNSGRSGSEGQNVCIQIPAQILIKHGGQEMELFIVVFLCKKIQIIEKKKRNVTWPK